MADISKITLPNGSQYNLKDAASRAELNNVLHLTGGNVTGPVNFGDSVNIDEATVGDIIVTGNGSFTNNFQVNTINGVIVGNNPQFTDTTYSAATESADGLMTAAEKTKLAGIAANAEVNVQSDWNVIDTTSDAYIKNKPTIPVAVIVDSTLSSSSENPVQNKVINTALNDKADKSATVSTVAWDSTNKKLTQTINGTTSDIITADNLRTGLNVANGAEVNQNAFSNVKVGSTTVAADSKTDTLTLVAGSNITLTPDASKDEITISATDTNTWIAMGGATSSTAGTEGYVPAPPKDGYNTKYLRADGTWSVPPDNNTTYESKNAVNGGTDLSLVTTGEKYNWNNKTSNTGTVTNVETGVGLTTANGNSITTTGTVKTKLRSQTALTRDSAAATETADRVYPIAVDKSGYLAVNVPWTDTTYNFDYQTSGNNRAIQVDDNNNLYVVQKDNNTVPAAYCSTAAGTAAKTATHSGYSLLNNSYELVTLTNTNTAQSKLTLNINSKGAKNIYINGAISSSSNYTLPAGTYLTYYDGTNYHFRTDGQIPNQTAYSLNFTMDTTDTKKLKITFGRS